VHVLSGGAVPSNMEARMSKRVAKGQSKGKKVVAKKVPPEIEATQPAATEAALSEAKERDPRLPPVGTVLTKERGRQTHQVTVLADGFEYKGEKYRSLSKIARLITGVNWNGFAFFCLATRKPTKAA